MEQNTRDEGTNFNDRNLEKQKSTDIYLEATETKDDQQYKHDQEKPKGTHEKDHAKVRSGSDG